MQFIEANFLQYYSSCLEPLDPFHIPSYSHASIKHFFWTLCIKFRKHFILMPTSAHKYNLIQFFECCVILIFSDAHLFRVASWSCRRGADGVEHSDYLHHVEISQAAAPFPVHHRHKRWTEISSVDIYLIKRTCEVHCCSSIVWTWVPFSLRKL
jgi:hypothetical protein